MQTDVFSSHVRAGIRLYDFIWRIGIPLLRLNRRLLTGWVERCGAMLPGRADLWLHAASAGEAYLVHEIVDHLPPMKKWCILATTNTRQGLDILNRLHHDPLKVNNRFDLLTHYFPFDRPLLMRKVVDSVRPLVVGILETELWPGLLSALKSRHIPVVIVNGRINPSSLKRYRIWPSFWNEVAPSNVLAVSNEDACRFEKLFNGTPIETMSNIKFDQWHRQLKTDVKVNPLTTTIRPNTKLVVLGSIRQDEEAQVLNLIAAINKKVPDGVIALFPRHMHRIDAWQNRLTRHKIPWVMRSRMKHAVATGNVIIWDTFGELRHAYTMATSVFVGGSLAPLGGQNFLEPLACGIIPVIGPSWYNFHWVGEKIFDMRLVYRVADWRGAANRIIMQMKQPAVRDVVFQQAIAYARDRCGGAAQVCRLLQTYIDEKRRK